MFSSSAAAFHSSVAYISSLLGYPQPQPRDPMSDFLKKLAEWLWLPVEVFYCSNLFEEKILEHAFLIAPCSSIPHLSKVTKKAQFFLLPDNNLGVWYSPLFGYQLEEITAAYNQHYKKNICQVLYQYKHNDKTINCLSFNKAAFLNILNTIDPKLSVKDNFLYRRDDSKDVLIVEGQQYTNETFASLSFIAGIVREKCGLASILGVCNSDYPSCVALQLEVQDHEMAVKSLKCVLENIDPSSIDRTTNYRTQDERRCFVFNVNCMKAIIEGLKNLPDLANVPQFNLKPRNSAKDFLKDLAKQFSLSEKDFMQSNIFEEKILEHANLIGKFSSDFLYSEMAKKSQFFLIPPDDFGVKYSSLDSSQLNEIAQAYNINYGNICRVRQYEHKNKTVNCISFNRNIFLAYVIGNMNLKLNEKNHFLYQRDQSKDHYISKEEHYHNEMEAELDLIVKLAYEKFGLSIRRLCNDANTECAALLLQYDHFKCWPEQKNFLNLLKCIDPGSLCKVKGAHPADSVNFVFDASKIKNIIDMLAQLPSLDPTVIQEKKNSIRVRCK